MDIYIHAYLMYNISMNVKMTSQPLERIRRILKDQNGLLFTSDLSELGIPRTYLAVLERKGEIRRIARGVYSPATTLGDEMAALQGRNKVAVFSHETAAFLLDLTDRAPLFYSVTVPSGYNATLLKKRNVKVYFVNRKVYPLGLITIKSSHGNDIQTFNLERTICDLLRNRNQIDIQQINTALKRYVKSKEKNIDLLFRYAKLFRVQKIIREYIEVLL